MRRIVPAVATWGLAGLVLISGPWAAAQTDGLTIRGSVTGELAQGQRVSFRLTSSHPEGFLALKELTMALTLRGVALEELTYDVDEGSVAAENDKALVGTGDSVTGRFFQVSALGVRVSTAGDRLTLSFAAEVLDDIPPGTRFRFTATDDVGEEVSIGVLASVEEDGGLSFFTVALAIGAALVAGGFVGARVAAHRQPPPSIYGTVARRVREEREGAGPRPPRRGSSR